MPLTCQTFAAHQWLSRRPCPSSLLLGPPLTEVKSSGPDRGQGLFALRTIPAFTQILSDTPMILMKPTDDLPRLYSQFQSLSTSQKDIYLSLSYTSDSHRAAMMQDKLLQRGFDPADLAEMITVASIMQTNAFNVDLADGQGSTHRALFPKIARINHACAPNAHVCYYPPDTQSTRGRMLIHSLRDLEQGEEVLISYFSILMAREQRMIRTKKWGFECACKVCDETAPGQARAEALRKEFEAFKVEQARLLQRADAPVKKLNRCIERGKSLIDASADSPDFIPALPDVYDGLALLHAQASSLQGRTQETEKYQELLEKAAICDARITGPSSPATVRRLRKLETFSRRKGESTKPSIISGKDGELKLIWTD